MSSKVEQLRAQLNERILVLDGGMGTMIQSYRLNEADFRGERFADWPCDLKGNNDLLVLSKPEVIAAITIPCQCPVISVFFNLRNCRIGRFVVL